MIYLAFARAEDDSFVFFLMYSPTRLSSRWAVLQWGSKLSVFVFCYTRTEGGRERKAKDMGTPTLQVARSIGTTMRDC